MRKPNPFAPLFRKGGPVKLAGGGAKKVSEAIAKGAKKVLTPSQEAFELARIRAALPIEKGGLGLPANNTAADRAAAMGFTKDTYHGTLHDIPKFDVRKASTESHAGKGVYSSSSPRDASENYASVYGPDVKSKIERSTEMRDRYPRRVMSALEAEALSPERQAVLAKEALNADNLGVVYPLKVRSDKPVHIDKDEANPVMIEPYERYDDDLDQYVFTENYPTFRKALDEFSELGGEPNDIFDFVGDYADEFGRVKASDLFDAVKRSASRRGVLIDPYTGDPVSSGVAAADFLRHFGVDEIRHTPMFGNKQLNIADEHTISMDPDNVRSRFAAFDPFRKSSAIAAALGVAAPDLLAEELEKKEPEQKAQGGLIRMQDGGDPRGEMKASPQNPVLGALARGLRSAQNVVGQYQVDPRIPLVGGMGVDELLGIPGAAGLVEDVSYYGPKAAIKGGNVATGGIGTFTLDPRVVDVASVAELGGLGAQAAKGAGKAIGQQLQRQVAMNPLERQIGAIKPKGGNWVTGSVENKVAGLKSAVGPRGLPAEKVLAEMNATYTPDVMASLSPESAAHVERSFADLKPKAAINEWIDKKLTKYIKNEMATPDDPIIKQIDQWELSEKPKKLAEIDGKINKTMADMEAAMAKRQVTPEMMTHSQEKIRKLQREREFINNQKGAHFYGGDISDLQKRSVEMERGSANLPKEGFAKSSTGKAWENTADSSIESQTVGDTLEWYRQKLKDKEGYQKAQGMFAEDQYMQNIINAARQRDSTDKVSQEALANMPWMEKVDPKTNVYELQSGVNGVEFRHLIDELNNAMNPNTDLPEHLRITPETLNKMNMAQASKLVDDINAHRAVQQADANKAIAANIATSPIKTYDVIPGSDLPNQSGYKWVELKLPEGGNIEEGRKALEDALNYEGSMLKHCVGGYCPAVESGETRIISLRDANGRPHATIEIEPPSPDDPGNTPWDYAKDADEDLFSELMTAPNKYEYNRISNYVVNYDDFYKDWVSRGPSKILQVKGMQNRKPSEEVIPFVQDFIRSGNYTIIDDLKNTDLIEVNGKYEPKPQKVDGEGYKDGGPVKLAGGGRKKLAERAAVAVKEFVDPKTTKIEDWQWKPLAEVDKQLKLAEVPDYIQRGYGDFMIEQAKRASSGQMGVRDLIKAFGITQSSIGRGGLSHATATKAGLKVPKTEGLVRPEGAFAEWLGSKMGQKFLDDAERGVVNEKALDDIRTKFAPFGKPNQLTEQLAYAVNNLPNVMPQMQQALTGPVDQYRDWAESMKGIAGAKSGFIGSLLGRGDLPTLDARQLNLHALEAPVGTGSIMARGKGLGAREAVDRLAARQSALGLDIDPTLDPYYQHLAHHAVWDKVANEKTTHDDLMRALRGYKAGGQPDIDAMRFEMQRKSWRSK